MKKTFTINISGIIFHIDDDAYSKLNSYLSSIKRHFNNLNGKEEVIADIENRIAEILQAKLTDTKQVIGIEDIDEVILIMGQPSEFADEEEDSSEPSRTHHAYKRLYRDSENKMIGGVASGIAAYLHTDPLWIRILFIISLFTTLGIFIYVILWIALPEALTTTERLEMKGEKVNISNIEKSLKDEFDNLKGKINDLTKQAKETVKKKSDIPKTFFEDILELCINIVKVFFKGLMILLGIIILLTGLGLVLGFIGLFFNHGFFFFDDAHVSIFPAYRLIDIFLSSSGNIGLLKVGLFFFIGIPVIMLIYAGIRLIFGFEKVQHLGLTMFILWIMGLIFTLTFSFRIFQNLKYEVDDKQEYAIEQPSTNEIYLDTQDLDRNSYSNYEDYITIDDFEIVITHEGYLINQVRMEITESYNDQLMLIKHSSARGRTGFDAKMRAEKTIYEFEQDNNKLFFNDYYMISNDVDWADQQLWLELKVPVGTIIHLSDDMYRMLKHRSRYYYYSWSDRIYIMTEDGLEKIDEIDKTEEIEEVPEKKDSVTKGYSNLNFTILIYSEYPF
ncbi:MAG: PspC domain-containing protein [Bacteroidetes bacterium]|nr:PspC domain-containing protein [Bacteroidota bacterium]